MGLGGLIGRGSAMMVGKYECIVHYRSISTVASVHPSAPFVSTNLMLVCIVSMPDWLHAPGHAGWQHKSCMF
jgi:hypothetical protein